MPSSAPVLVEALGPCKGAALRWSVGGEAQLTIVIKATVQLVDGGAARAIEPRPVSERDTLRADDRPSSVVEACDLVPFLPSAGVVLGGHAYAPAQREVEERSVRLSVYGARPLVDKTLRVVGDRPPGASGAPRRFQRMPLVYERAYGGPLFADNPVGVGAESDPRRLPNVLDPSNEHAPAGFGPRSRWWGASGERLREALRARGAASWALPPEFKFDWLQVAPLDQTVAYLTGDEWIVLEGMSATSERIQARLPDLRAEALLELGEQRVEIGLAADTLQIDADTLRASIVWRGRHRVGAEHAEPLRAIVQVVEQGAPIEWPEREGKGERIVVPPLPPPPIVERSPRGSAAPEPPAPTAPPDVAPRPRELPTYLRGTETAEPGTSSIPKSGDGPVVAPRRLDESPDEAALDEDGEPQTLDAAKHDDKRAEAMRRASAGQSLAGLDLANADLSELDLAARDLEGANLTRANLRRAKLEGARLRGAVLEGADLSGANLAEADLTEANLSAAVLCGATLRGAALTGATLVGADAREAQLAKANARKARLTGARLGSASLEGADLRDADLSSTELSGATFAHAKLEGANLAGATGAGTVFNGALMIRASFNQAKLDKAFFVRVVAQSSSWEQASVEGALFTEANLTSAHLGRANLSGADLVGSNLSQARLRQAECAEADFSSADLSSARLQGIRAEGAKWRSAKLDGADLREAHLVGAQLSQASLSRGWADRADFSDGVLEGADLRRCSMRSANLARADLRKANMTAADLRDADLTDARGEGAVTTSAKLAGAKLEGFSTEGGGGTP